MWTVYGILTLAIQPGILQVVEKIKFDNPQDCFREAMVIMQDANDPRGMACVPILTEKGEDA
jgi:hypothetical protein